MDAKSQLGVELPVSEQAVEEPAAEESAAEERPEWLPENFKTPEDFARSYSELEKKHGEQGREVGELRRMVEQFSQQQATPQQPTPQLGDASGQQAVEQLAEAYGVEPAQLGLMAWLAQQAAEATITPRLAQFEQGLAPANDAQNELLATTATQALRTKYEDWGDYSQKVADLMEANPDLLPEQSMQSLQGLVNAFDRAYQLAKYQDIISSQAETKQTEAANSRAAKLQAQTMTGATGRPVEASETDAEISRMKRALQNSSYAARMGG